MPVPKEYVFVGEYSFDGTNWYPYNANTELSALEGDVVVKGHLDSDVPEGGILNLYNNHIGISIYVNGEMIYMDAATEFKTFGKDLPPSVCGKRWEQLMCPEIMPEDEIEFHFTNWHKYGNEKAYKEVLSSLLMTPPDNTILEEYLMSYIEPFEKAGYALLMVAMMLLGASLYAFIFKSDMRAYLLKMGLATLFVAGFTMFDIMMLYLTNDLLVVKTYGRQMCLMLAIYFVGMMICDSLKDKFKKVANVVIIASGILNFALIGIAAMGKVLIFDTLLYWEVAQYIISGILIMLCILQMIKDKKFRIGMTVYVAVNVAIILDLLDVSYSKYYSGIWFKTLYVGMIVIFLFRGAKQVMLDHQASAKNKKLKVELEQSRIAVMLSQIQPHFLYNSLTSVMDLCDREPKQAKAAIADFADYLRGNLSSLKTENPIPFTTELEHIEKYLKLEKLRFQDELEIVYDIQVQDFMLPALSVQPLIENAVKHGVGQKIGGGTVTIHASENENDYVITIEDDGVGFVEGEYADDESTHIGIENIKKRLDMMMSARLVIESQKGVGTKASIFIPKRRD